MRRSEEGARQDALRGSGAIALLLLLAACGAPASSRSRSDGDVGDGGAAPSHGTPATPVKPAARTAAAPTTPRPLVETLEMPAASGDAVATTTYRLAVGDVLKIVVVEQPDLSCEVPVPPHGEIELAVVGTLALLGRTSQEVSQEILARLEQAEFLLHPQVSVSISRFAPRRVFVVEGVEKPEAYELPSGGALHLTQVIALAGGLAKGADPSQVTILRRAPGLSPQLLRVDLRAILDSDRMDADPLLLPDDTVIVRDLKQGEEQVFVTGRVRTPGAYRFSRREGLTLLQSIVIAGGLDKYARPAGAALLRRTDGGRKTILVDLERILAGELERDVALEAGDVVFIPESFF